MYVESYGYYICGVMHMLSHVGTIMWSHVDTTYVESCGYYICTHIIYILEKWFPLQGERAHSLKLFCMYDKRFEISKTK